MADDKANKDNEDEEVANPETEVADSDESGADKKKRSGKMMLIIGAVVLVVLAGGAAGAFYLMHAKKNDSARALEEANSSASEAKGKVVYYPLGDLLVNLSGESKHPNFLKVKISLELADEKDLPLMDAIKPRIIDNFQVYLRELRIDDLRGSAGMYRLREELLMRVTEASQPVRIRDVLFQEMLVQ